MEPSLGFLISNNSKIMYQILKCPTEPMIKLDVY